MGALLEISESFKDNTCFPQPYIDIFLSWGDRCWGSVDYGGDDHNRKWGKPSLEVCVNPSISLVRLQSL